MRSIIVQTFLCLLLITLAITQYQAAPYAEWAHSHVIWLNGKEQNQTAIESLLKTYQSYQIPVGGVNIDSDWSTCFNNFQFNRVKFPNPEKLVQDFHAQGVKVILWATSIVNTNCALYDEGLKNGYFLNNGKHVHWWHGQGAFVDFFNPKAKEWWFRQMDKVINMGFDGWKNDGADPIILLLRPWPYSNHLKRYITYPQYAHQYYGSFYNYTKSKNPDALIMSRPVDSLKNKVFLSYSPKYVMFSGWVGDQDSSAAGFQEAMVNILHSASKGYLNFGFDIGGYRGQNISKNIYLRWMQTGALLPFMENGGNGKHQPWKFDAETIDIYRKFTLLHYALKQFFLTAGTEAYKKKVSVIQPLVKDTKTIELTHSNNFGYVLWNTFLHFPIFQENGFTNLTFPKGNKWIYYFNHSKVFEGGSTLAKAFKIDESPFFMKPNTIIPVSSQIWAVYLSLGVHQQTIIGGNYSDNVRIECKEAQILIEVNRFYKDEETKKLRSSEDSIKVRLMGMSISKLEEQGIKHNTTEYQRQIQIQIVLGVRTIIANVTHFSPEVSQSMQF